MNQSSSLHQMNDGERNVWEVTSVCEDTNSIKSNVPKRDTITNGLPKQGDY